VPAGIPLILLAVTAETWYVSRDGRVVANADTVRQVGQAVRETQPERLDARRILVADSWSRVLEPSTSRQFLPLRPDERAMLEDALRRHPHVTPAEVEQARRLLGERRRDPFDDRRLVVMMAAFAVGLLAVIGLASVVLSMPLEGGVGFHAAGVIVQCRDGSEPGPLRFALRAIVTWSPVAPCWLWHFAPALDRSLGITSLDRLVAVTLIPLGVGALYALWRPERGLQDLVAGTQLVPR
jgi:hypothetical protein